MSGIALNFLGWNVTDIDYNTAQLAIDLYIPMLSPSFRFYFNAILCTNCLNCFVGALKLADSSSARLIST